MTLFDNTIDIQAPPDMVWPLARKFARKGRITSEQLDRLLVAEEARLAYVYWLEQQADGSTRLRHVVESASKIQEALRSNHNFPDALDILASAADTPGQTALGAVLGSFALSPSSLGESRIEEIRKKAERAARKAKWRPEPITVEPPSATMASALPKPQTLGGDLAKKSSAKSQKVRRGFFGSLSLAFDVVKGSFRLLWLYPILIVPLIPVFVMVLGVEFGLLFIDSLALALIVIFVVAYALMFSFAISSHMLQQLHEGQKPSLIGSVCSSGTVRMIPKVFLLSLIWYVLVLILVAIEMAIKTLLSRVGEGAGEKAEGIIEGIFGTVASALRMMGFMLIPIMIFEDVSLSKGFQRLKSVLQDSPISALGGLVLTKLATTLIFFIVVVFFQVVGDANTGFIMLFVGFPILGLGWMLAMYLEQLFVTGLYLYSTFPESPVVSILLKEQIGRELPRVAVPEMAEKPMAL